jgi:RNA polymerase sigma-70 factor (ECF subfamily)
MSAEVVKLHPQEEADLIAAARQNPTAFARLYKAYVRPVYRYLFSRVGHASDAEDLTAQVFLEALEGLPGYQHEGHFAAWLFGIARRKAVDHFRRRTAELPLESAGSGPMLAPDPLLNLIQADDVRRLALHIRRLPESEQELLRLRFVAELSFVEVAALSGRSAQAVKKQLYRLLARLKSQLEIAHESADA